MGEIVSKPGALTLDEVKAAIAFDQPKLSAMRQGSDFVILGDYLLFENSVIANPAGPISEFAIKMVVSERFPKREPKVFETDGRIPRTADHHINPDGDCCVTVWENWLVCAADHSFAAYMNGPLHEFFLGQYWFEKTGKWPFGERTHGAKGLEEAYADALGIHHKKKDLIYHLRMLSQDWPKGHWPCPCGSGKKLRDCHRDKMMGLHNKVPPGIARQMLSRLKSQSK
ncbi:MAG: SEC-C domain-containing protein [Hyphomicrobiales bacterium]|nr:SEC-C domain-containing protein [Hyphomicrobiales bacterium]MCP5372030.1 SEC-C domain-containing protein [Hyphomicrobiales bacterium]